MVEVSMIMKTVELLLAKSHSTKTRWHLIKVVRGEFKTDKAKCCFIQWVLNFWNLLEIVESGSIGRFKKELLS